MAKPSKAGGDSASTPVQEAAPPPAVPRVASGRRTESPDLVKSEQAAMQAAEAMAAELAGIDMVEPTAEVTKKAPAAKKAEPQADADASRSDDPDEGPQFNPDAPILADEEGNGDPTDDDAAAEGAAATDDPENEDDPPEVAALKKENFKQREKKRELEAQIKALADEKAELQRKLSTLETTPTAMPDLGIYAEAKTVTEVEKIEAQQSQFIDYLENLLDDVQEVYTLPTAGGREQDFTRQQLRDHLREAKLNVKMAEKARKALQISHEAEAKARKVYPWVFDPKAKNNGVVLDLVQETPALNALPNKALLLGRLAIGKMVESGKYYLVPYGTKKPKAQEAEERRPTVSAAPSAARRSAPVARPKESVLDRINRGDSQAAEDAALELLNGHPGL